MVCVVLVLSISNLSISFEGVSAMPDRNVQGVCDIANASFPKGCTKAKIDAIKRQQIEIKKSAALEFIALLENTVEARCIFWYRARQESIDSVKANSTAFYPDEQLTSAEILRNSKAITDLTGVSDGLDLMEKNYMWPGYEDLVKKFLLDQRSKSKPYWEITDQFRLDWDALLISRAPIVWSQIKKAGDAYNASSSALAKISATPLTTPKTTTTTIRVTTTSIKHSPASCQNGVTVALATLVKTCKNGSWVYDKKPTTTTPRTTSTTPQKTKTTAPSSGSIKKPSSASRVKIGVGCESRASGLQSSISGMSYSWSTWAIYSDGTTGPKFGGFGSNPPC